MTSVHQQRLLLISVAIVIGMTVAITFGARNALDTPETREHALLVVPPPQNIQELVQSADIIVLGTITAVIAEGPFVGYDQNGNVIGATPVNNASPHLPAETFWRTDFAITPIRLLKGNNLANSVIILRESNTWTTSFQQTYTQLPLASQQLFFLTLNPDKKTYGASIWQKMILDDAQVRYFNADRAIPAFAHNQTGVQFLNEVIAAIALQH